jgi:hypothetical protein
MRRVLIVLACLHFPFCMGCATEREYFFNHNPITDSAIFVGEMVGGFFEPLNSDLTDVQYSQDKPAEIHYLNRR